MASLPAWLRHPQDATNAHTPRQKKKPVKRKKTRRCCDGTGRMSSPRTPSQARASGKRRSRLNPSSPAVLIAVAVLICTVLRIYWFSDWSHSYLLALHSSAGNRRNMTAAWNSEWKRHARHFPSAFEASQRVGRTAELFAATFAVAAPHAHFSSDNPPARERLL